MPKFRRILSVVLAVWLFVMLVGFTYTWVSRNWSPSIKADDINIASSGALVISIVGDDAPLYESVPLNDVVGLEVSNSFTFRQVSSQDGVNFFWKDFSPQVIDKEAPALFKRISGTNDTHKRDYVEAKFCLMLDGSLTEEKQSKYIFIHPDSMISYTGDCGFALNEAIRISLTYTNDDGIDETVILADLGDGSGLGGTMVYDKDHQAVANLKGLDEFSEFEPGALGNQTIYDLHYFDCGRTYFNEQDKFAAVNYEDFDRDENRTLFKLMPGETKWITIRIWLEGQDFNCKEDIAGEKFDMLLKFDSVFVVDQE